MSLLKFLRQSLVKHRFNDFSDAFLKEETNYSVCRVLSGVWHNAFECAKLMHVSTSAVHV